MATGVTFDSNNLQTANILTAEIAHEGLPTKDAQIYALAHANKSGIPFVSYPNKTITLSGKVIDTSITGLDTRLDSFRGYFTGTDKNLDIDYNGTTRRYIATLSQITIDRPGGLTYANFSITFVCTQPFGQNTATTTALTASGRTNASYTDAYTFLGNAPVQWPIATITLTSCITNATNLVTNGGFEVDTSGWSSGGIGTFTRITGQHNTGVAAAQMVNAASSPLSSPVANTYGWELYNVSGLTIGANYTVSAFLKGNAGGESVGFETLLSPITTTVLTTAWQKVSFTFTAANTTDQIYLFSTTASATWFIDDISIILNGGLAQLAFGNNTNGQAIYIKRTWLSGDVIVIDVIQKTVTVNAIATNFSGAFPEFPPGSQTFYYVDNFLTRTFSITVVYYPMFY